MLNEQLPIYSDDIILPTDDELASRVLDNIEQMHPQYLAKLLWNGDLAEVMQQRVDWYKRTIARLREALPNEPYEALDDRARDCLGGMNRNRQNEKPLTVAEKTMLNAFRGEHRL